MRMIVADLKDAYHVHKTMNEYLLDIGQAPIQDYFSWVSVLSSESHRYVILMHSKKVVGMVWGRSDGPNEFLIQGRFLRRAYRGKFRFTKKLFKAKMEIVKGYATIKEVRLFVGKRKPKAFII
jgi:hypothetical protein